MNNFYSCIECGYYPVSSTARKCPQCSRNPLGENCYICNKRVADSKKITHSVWNSKSDTHTYYYFHPECLNKACPVCSTPNTGGYSCSKCGHPFDIRITTCLHCLKPLQERLAVKGEGLLEYGLYHGSISIIGSCYDQALRAATEKVKRDEEDRIRAARYMEEKKIRDQISREEQRQKQEIDKKQRKIDDWWQKEAPGIIITTVVCAGLGLLTISTAFWFSIICFAYFLAGILNIFIGMNGLD